MANNKKQYKNMDKWKEATRKQKNRYYKKTEYTGKKRVWTDEEKELLFNCPLTDTELSDKIKRSVKAIQVMRSRLVDKNSNT